MKIVLLVAGPLRGRGLGRAVLERVGDLRGAGHEALVVLPATEDLPVTPPEPCDAGHREVDRAWLATHGIEPLCLSLRDVLRERLDRPVRVLDAQALVILYGAYHPLLESLRLFSDCPVIMDYAGLPPPGRGAPQAAREAWARSVHQLTLARHASLSMASSPHTAAELATVASPGRASVRSAAPPDSLQGDELRRGTPAVPFPLMLTVGRPSVHKRLCLLVEVVARVARVHPGARLIVAGDHADPEADTARQDALAWARALGVLERIEFLGHVSDAQLAGLHATAQVAVFAADHPGHGYAAAEALARGCPVVNTGPTALPPSPILTLVPPDAAAFGAAVLALLDPVPAPRSGPVSASSAPAPPSPPTLIPDAATGSLPAPAASRCVLPLPSPGLPRPSLVPLIEEVARRRVPYVDAQGWPLLGPLISWARSKVMRHLTKFFARQLETLALEVVHRTSRELRTLDADLTLLEARVQALARARRAGAPHDSGDRAAPEITDTPGPRQRA